MIADNDATTTPVTRVTTNVGIYKVIVDDYEESWMAMKRSERDWVTEAQIK